MCKLDKKPTVKNRKKPSFLNKKGKFKKGNNANPNGRPKGAKNHDGLQAVLNMFKDLISKESNLKKLEIALQANFDKQPLYFYYKYVMPILPKNIEIPVDASSISIIFNNVKSLPKGDKKK